METGKVKNLSVMILVSFSLSAIGFSSGVYSGGNGTSANPYQMANANDIDELSHHSEDWTRNFTLTSDIDMSNYTYDTAVIASDISPNYDFQGLTFIGKFDGNGHVIRNLTINVTVPSVHGVGLFGATESGAVINNLGLENINYILGSRTSRVGGLVGIARDTTITNCYVTGTIDGGPDDSGSLGGLVGYSDTSDISYCYTECDISSVLYNCGGLVATLIDESTLTVCYSTGNVSGKGYLGGAVGTASSNSVISNCYATGDVSCWEGEELGAGGFACSLSGSVIIDNCYSIGYVQRSLNSGVGGFLVSTYLSNVYDCFWDMDTSGLPISHTGTGKITVEMQTESTFINAGWDFLGETSNGTEEIWIMHPLSGYPVLTSVFDYVLTVNTEPNIITNVTPAKGQHDYSGWVVVDANSYIDCPDIYIFDHWSGDVVDPNSATTSIYMDGNENVTAHFNLVTPVCGDECHDDNLFGDYDHNCIIDITDFAQFALNWMMCTKPECD